MSEPTGKCSVNIFILRNVEIEDKMIHTLCAVSTTYFKDMHYDIIFVTMNYVKSDFRSTIAGENIAACVTLNFLISR
jgi:hypothetical protein